MPSSKKEKSITPNVNVPAVDRNIAILEARNELQQALISFLRKWKYEGLKWLGHNLAGDDLVPLFHRYAWTLINIRYRENILGATSSETAMKIIRASIDKALDDICGTIGSKDTKPGLWGQMTRLACDAVGLWFWETPDGEFPRGLLFRAKRAQLRARLLAQGRELRIEYLKNETKLDGPLLEEIPPAIKPAEPKQLPPFAQWLEDRKAERKWNQAKLISQSKVDRKTIRKIYKGEKITQKPLHKLAIGLSKKYKPILPSEIDEIQERLQNPSALPVETNALGKLH